MTRTTMALHAAVLGVLLSHFVGCDTPKDSRIPPRDTVHGTVTLDGEPLTDASIMFASPEDARRGIQASTNIVDGKYELLVTPGNKTVKISQVVEVKPLVFENLVPAKYNLKTTLKAELSEQNKEFNFELTSD